MEAWSKVSKMPAAAIRKMQSELLQKMLNEQLAERHPYYRTLFKENNINPADIKSIEDLKELPLTGKKDILPPEGEPRHPKKFVLEPPAEGEKKSKKKGLALFGKKDTGPEPEQYKFHTLYFTAGRTAKPIPIEYTHLDLANLREAGARAIDVWGLTRDDTMVNAFTYAPNAYFWQMYYSTIDLGSTALQTGGGKVLGLEKVLKAAHTMEAPVMAVAPGYAIYALQTLENFGFTAENLERIITGIDYTPMEAVDKIRRLMQAVQAKDNRVQRFYSISEAKSGWAECEPGYGYHTFPDHVLVEIVDPESGEVLGEGEKGEVVITHLEAAGTVLLRYRTDDIATGGLVTEPCPNCKRTVPRIMGDIERKAQYYELRGKEGVHLFNGNHLRKLMFARDDVLLWYAEINRTNSDDNLKVVVKGASGTDEAALLQSLNEELGSKFQVQSSVESISLDAVVNKIGLEKFITEKTIFDNRQS